MDRHKNPVPVPRHRVIIVRIFGLSSAQPYLYINVLPPFRVQHTVCFGFKGFCIFGCYPEIYCKFYAVGIISQPLR